MGYDRSRNQTHHQVHGKRLSVALLEEMDRTGYDIVQKNGQRIYGPGPGVVCPTPPKGCEVYISNLRDRGLFENDLIPLFSTIGPLYQFRMMLDFDGNCRGYAYATYFEKAHALEAIRKLHGYRIGADFKLEVTKSRDNTRLFVAAIPEMLTREEVFEIFSGYVDGMVDVVMLKCRRNSSRNRGYVFLEFEDHQLAYRAKRDLRNYKFWGKELRVEWAEACQWIPRSRVEQEKPTLFLTNLPPYFTAGDAMVYINRMIDSCVISEIRKISHYGFLDFYNRTTAEFALVALNGLVMAGRKIRVDWAYAPMKTSSKSSESGLIITGGKTKVEWSSPAKKAHEGINFWKPLNFGNQSFEAYGDKKSNVSSNEILPRFILEQFDNEEIQSISYQK